MTIRIPRTAESRRALTYAKLLFRVHPDRTMANAFEGVLPKPGALVDYAALWPTAEYPAKPVLLEYAGNDRTGKGHNRSKQVYILWRFEPGRGWVEIVRTLSQAAEWIMLLVPIALRELGGPPAPDPDLAANVTKRFFSQLDSELRLLGAGDQHLTLSLFYEQIAARLVAREPG